MQQLEKLLAQIIDKKHRLDDIREQSPELAEALHLSDEYHRLMNEVREMCNPTPAIPQIVPMYPVRPFWESLATHTADNTATVGSHARLRLMINGKNNSRA